jgi:hypothetical protein
MLAGNPSIGLTPDALNILNTSGFAKVINNKVAIQKTGIEKNINKIIEDILSKSFPLLAAALMPIGMLIK